MTRYLPARTFKMKLLFIIWVGSIISLLLAGGGFIFLEISEFNKDLTREMEIMANFISDKSAPAIMFNDRVIAEDALLSAAAIEPAITSAVIYDLNSNVIASFERNPSDHNSIPIPELQRNTSFIRDARLHFFADINMYSDQIGVLYIQARRDKLQERLERYAIIVMGIMLVSLLFLVPISFLLQRTISAPILALIASAKQISEKKDYTIRVENQGDDELGGFVDAFNEMLTQIQGSDSKVRESEAKYRELVEQSPIGLALCRLDGQLLSVNPAYAEIIGYSVDEAIKLSYWEVTPERYAAEEALQLEELERSGRYGPYEKEYFHKEGYLVPVRLNGMKVFRDGEKLIWSSVEDITALKKSELEKDRLEDHLRQSQKMEAVGTLAGGIAHDFNNILAAILGYSELILTDEKLALDTRENLGEVLSAAKRARELVKQILMFSRKEEEQRSPVQIHLLVEEATKLLRKTIPTTIDVNIDADHQTGFVLADPTQLHQVVMNLGTNAYHAMREMGGRLDIQLEPIEVDHAIAARHPGLKEGQFAQLTIKDSGMGMTTATMARIFDPFFTTKDVGEGTGMGLSVVHGIIQSHGGAIGVESRLDSGTTFKVFLPLVQGEEAKALETVDTPKMGSEHILLVDDEPALASLGEKRLESLGYQVTSFTSPKKALEFFRTNSQDFDLMITDQSMPELSGDRLAREIMKLRPGFPVIIYTGYSETLNETKAQEIGVRALLMKPLDRSVLSKTLRRILDQPR